MSQDDEPFLSRWSRRKHEARREEAAGPEAATPVAEPETTSAPAALTEAPPAASVPVASPESPVELPPELPPIHTLDGLRSDYQAFLGKTVDEDTRRSALKKLFGDPHFNQMDGLDVYVDDYTQFEPLPAAMRLTLRHAREFLLNSERLAMGLDPSPGFESASSAASVAGSADAVPASPVTAAVPADPDAAVTPATAAQRADAVDPDAIDGTAYAAPSAGEALVPGLASTEDGAPAPRPTPPARDPAAGSAAPPTSSV